jgi:hypothetical protein
VTGRLDAAGMSKARLVVTAVTAGALLVRGSEILLVAHRAYGIVLQPGATLSRLMSRWPERRNANWRRRPVSTRAR